MSHVVGKSRLNSFAAIQRVATIAIIVGCTWCPRILIFMLTTSRMLDITPKIPEQCLEQQHICIRDAIKRGENDFKVVG